MKLSTRIARRGIDFNCLIFYETKHEDIARRGMDFNCLIFYETKHEDSKERYGLQLFNIL